MQQWRPGSQCAPWLCGRAVCGFQRESSNLLRQVGGRLEQHSNHVNEQVNSKLKEYFDPDSGRFNERVKRLISKDGELEQLLRRQIGTQDSELAKTLLHHFGEKSPLMKRLSPDESEGLICALRGVVEEQLKSQRDRVLQEFSPSCECLCESSLTSTFH